MDEEPPPRPAWQIVAWTAVVLAVATGCGVLVWALSVGTGRSSSVLPVSAQTGHILSLNEFGALLDSHPDGRHLETLSGLGRLEQGGLPSVSPGGGLVAFPDGLVLATGSGRPVVRARLSLGARQVLTPVGAFSAGGRDVVVVAEGQYLRESATVGVSVVDISSRSSADLGTASFAVGDPMAPGAVLAVASDQPAGAGVQNPSTPDSGLELRDVGQPTVELATAGSLATDVGLDASTPVSFLPVPSPSGALVAVEVQDLLEPAGGAAGLAVLDRHGKMVAAQSPGLGPDSEAWPVWSPDGSMLAYSSQGPAGTVLDLWTVGGSLVSRPLPSGAGAAQCLWSPAGTAVLCDSVRRVAGTVKQTWSVAASGGGAVTEISGPGFAVDWYPG